MATRGSKIFHDLPPLLSDDFVDMPAGRTFSLLLLEYAQDVGWLLFPVEYVHEELIYRTPGQKDAVAIGKARLVDCGEFVPARILFSRPNQTAALKGLTLEGQVKLEPNNSLKRTNQSLRVWSAA